MQKFLETILNQCLNILDSEVGSILLLDKNKQDIVVRVARGKNRQSILGERMRLGQGISGQVALSKQPLLVADVRQEESISTQCRQENYQTHSFLSVPLMREDRLLGVLNVTEKNDGTPFSIKELSFVSAIAASAAQTIESLFAKEHLEAQLQCFKNSTAVCKFTAGISQELNNPLDGIMRYVNLCKEQAGEGTIIKEYLSEIQAGLKRMANVLRSMLEFSFAGDRNHNPVSRDLVNINDILSKSISFYKHQAICKQIDIETEFTRDLPLIRDCGLQQIFVNFVKNAFEAIDEKGKLNVKSYRDNGHLCVDFVDTGKGIDARFKDRIFEPFVTTKSRGQGLGLAIVKEIIDCYQGEVRGESVSQGGARFTVRLPIGG
ncbi:MAG: GAF domain-containing sensor histidine kinase [PVC group bacterium]|nr:GAF domain-containing sensor histidine kinase [PVC group bacterium]